MEKAEWTFRDLINPYIGNRPIAEIMPLELLTVFRRLEARGKHETAHRTKQRCGQVFRYALRRAALRVIRRRISAARLPRWSQRTTPR
jgi:Phage integrase central domain